MCAYGSYLGIGRDALSSAVTSDGYLRCSSWPTSGPA